MLSDNTVAVKKNKIIAQRFGTAKFNVVPLYFRKNHGNYLSVCTNVVVQIYHLFNFFLLIPTRVLVVTLIFTVHYVSAHCELNSSSGLSPPSFAYCGIEASWRKLPFGVED